MIIIRKYTILALIRLEIIAITIPIDMLAKLARGGSIPETSGISLKLINTK
jgi:hypothetical protein